MSDLKDTILVERITSSFSVEGRSPAGVKTSSFLSVTVRSHGDTGWTEAEAKVVESRLAKQVTIDVYNEALLRSQISKEQRDELVANVHAKFDPLIAGYEAKANQSANSEG